MPVQADALAADTLELRDTTATVTIDGVRTRQNMRLPFKWDGQYPGQQGRVSFDMVFDMPNASSVDYDMYVPSIGNAYAIWLNGTLLKEEGDLQDHNSTDYIHTPRYIEIAPGILREKTNALRIDVRADRSRHAGASAIVIGPDKVVYALYKRSYFLRSTVGLAIAVQSALVCIFALALWATQLGGPTPSERGRDPLYLLAWLAELCWLVTASDAIFESTPLRWQWWGVVKIAFASLWVYFTLLFCLHVAQWNGRRAGVLTRYWFTMTLLVTIVAVIGSNVYGHYHLSTAAYVMDAVSFSIFSVVFMYAAFHGGTNQQRVVSVVLLATILVGLYDLYLVRVGTAYDSGSYLRYMSLCFGFVLGYVVIARFYAVNQKWHDLYFNMAARVQEKESALQAQFLQVEELVREQGRSTERALVMQDMHDGVGSHLSLAILQLETGAVSYKELHESLRDTLDQLKLSIDNVNLPRGDVGVMLANFRYRLEPRFKALAIELQWAVEPLPILSHLDSNGMRNLQFVIYGALGNVLQHSKCKTLRIEAGMRGADIRIWIVDDGVGFNVASLHRNGLRIMHSRIKAIKGIEARLTISSKPGVTVVEIFLLAGQGSGGS